MGMIANLEAMLARGQDGALLRYSLGLEYMKQDDPRQAALHLRQAVKQDPGYSAAWKALGKALAAAGLDAEAITAYRTGIKVAEGKGDIQAAKEMKVFLKRLEQRPG